MRRLNRPWLALALLALAASAQASFVNYATREVNLKIVYAGVDDDAGEANLQYALARTSPDGPGKLIRLEAGEGKKTFFFNFILLTLGELRGFKTRFHLYSSVSASEASDVRRLIFKGTDAVVFIADSDPALRQANLDALRDLKTELAASGLDWAKVPLVVQLIHREHPQALPVEELMQQLGLAGRQVFTADPKAGPGVIETLKAAAKLCLLELSKDGEKSAEPPGPAKAGTEKPATR
jgi:hypothetical protein